MPRAILKNGLILPIEPLPPEWTDGEELWVEEARGKKSESLDRWKQDLEEAAARIDPEDDQRLQKAIQELRRKAKEQARREMGLT